MLYSTYYKDVQYSMLPYLKAHGHINALKKVFSILTNLLFIFSSSKKKVRIHKK